MTARLNRRAALGALWSAMRAHRNGGPTMGARVLALPRMIFASIRGKYDGRGRLALMTLASVYIISPIDLIPEAFLFLLGLIDDAVVLAWLAGALLAETERFIEWEKTRATGVGGRVISAAG